MSIIITVLILIVWVVIAVNNSIQRKGKPIEKEGEFYTPEEIEKFCTHIVMDFDSPEERRKYLRNRK